MESRNCINSYVDEVGTPAISATAGNYREVGTSPGRSGEQNEGSNLNSRDIHRGAVRSGCSHHASKRKFLKDWNMECENAVSDRKVGECFVGDEKQQA